MSVFFIFKEASNLITELRQQIIEQIKIRDKLRKDIEQLKHNYKAEICERERMEQSVLRDLNAAKDENRKILSYYFITIFFCVKSFSRIYST